MGPLFPVAALIDRSRIDELRSKHVCSYQSTRRSGPTTAISNIMFKKLQPQEPFHDPYIVALLIAEAEEQEKSYFKCHNIQSNTISTYLV